ncbi:MAG: molybdopterin-synthase adenylyltransferase MoeB [Gemmatimonadota bacterium]
MAEVDIRIPTPLRSFVGGRASATVRAETAGEAVRRLIAEHEGLGDQLLTADGELRRFVNVYLGERSLEGLEDDVALSEGDELRIVPSIAGGATEARSEARSEAPSEVRSKARPATPSGTGDATFSRGELQRYSRHLMIPEVGREGQAKLKGARVMLVGAGGLGSPAALYLAAAGVGTIGLVDDDVVELTNLQRQLLHDTPSIGQPKLRSARRRLEALNPEIEVVTHEARLTSDNALEILEGWDLVVDGSDNFPTRYLVNDACVFLGIPTVYGAIYRFEGQASVFGLEDGPCYRCLFPEPPPPGMVPSCADAGVLGVLPGIIGTIQAIEAVKLILGRGRPLAGRLLLFEALEMEFREVEIRRDPRCPVCGDEPTVTELIDYEIFCGLGADGEGGAEGNAAETGSEAPAIRVSELERWSGNGRDFRLVDVRRPYEWDICNLEELGAELLPLHQLEERMEELDRDETLVVYCRSGARSADAVRRLREEGFEAAFNLEGGILAWAREFDEEMPTY